MSKESKITLLKYIELKSTHKDDFNIVDVNFFLSRLEPINILFYKSLPLIYLLDFSTGKYQIASKSLKNILGYEAEEMLEGGIYFSLNLYHKDDRKIFNEEAFPERLSFLSKIEVSDQSKYIFSNNLRLKNSKNKFIPILQRSCVIKSDASGMPLLSLGMLINIEHFKRDTSIVQTIEKCTDSDGEPEYNLMKKSIFFPDEEDKVFSKREIEILKWIAEGLSSKQIATKLHITENTVLNHRKNMFYKSNKKNIAELINYVSARNII